MLVQRSITTSSPPAWAIAAASQFDDPELEPQPARADRDGFAGMRDAQLRPAEDVDEVDRTGRGDGVGDGREGRSAEDLALVRIDRHAVVALGQQVAEDPVRGAARVRRRPDDGDPSRRPERSLDARVVEHRDGTAALGQVEIGGRPVALLPCQVAASRSYGWPSAAGGMLRPTNPARTTIVTRYGSAS